MVLNPRQKSTLVLNIQLERLTLSCSTQPPVSTFKVNNSTILTIVSSFNLFSSGVSQGA